LGHHKCSPFSADKANRGQQNRSQAFQFRTLVKIRQFLPLVHFRICWQISLHCATAAFANQSYTSQISHTAQSAAFANQSYTLQISHTAQQLHSQISPTHCKSAILRNQLHSQISPTHRKSAILRNSCIRKSVLHTRKSG
jgi:hypothetical protein